MLYPSTRIAALLLSVSLSSSLSTPALAADDKEDIFTVGGFQLEQSPAQLKARFPLSLLEDGVNASGPSSRIMRVLPAEMTEQINYAQYFFYDKQLERLQLLVERPMPTGKSDAYYRNPYNQNPRCESMLRPFTQRYGKPSGPFDESEEMHKFAYVWEKPHQKLVLYCGRYRGDKNALGWVFGIAIAPSKAGSCKHKSCYENFKKD
jgi:hypothetical protein